MKVKTTNIVGVTAHQGDSLILRVQVEGAGIVESNPIKLEDAVRNYPELLEDTNVQRFYAKYMEAQR